MQYKLSGLNCPSCALKIEDKLKKELDPKASVNINTNTLTLEFGSKEEAASIIKTIEPHVEILPKDGSNIHDKQGEHVKSKFFSSTQLLILSAAFFGFGFFYKPLFLVSYLLTGYNVLSSAFLGIVRKDFLDEKFLMSIATIGAIAVNEWAEAAAVMVLYNLGEFLEDLASEKTKRSVTDLMELSPTIVNLIVDGESEIVERKPEDIQIDSLILVKPGERIPLDGVITDGYGTLDTKALTGESIPQTVKPGDLVMSGSINLNSPLKIKVTKLYTDSTIARMLRLLEDASGKKAKSERFITRFARYYTPIVVAVAILLFIVPPIFNMGTFAQWGYRSLVLLVVSCPCALVISVPLSYFSGIGRASQLGILVKSGEVFDKLAEIEATVWDKTGTLTNAEFEVVNTNSVKSISTEELTTLAASLEQFSNHPLAKAIVQKANELSLVLFEVTELKEIPGFGMEGVIGEDKIIVGSLNFINSYLHKDTLELSSDLASIAVLKITKDDRKHLLGYFELADTLKPSSKETIRTLKNKGLDTIVLTGDRKESAIATLKDLDLDDIKSELLPEDKLSYVEALSSGDYGKGKKVLFVGDGINDAPVIASSYVGVSMGGIGSDAAIEASDVVLMKDEPKKVPLLIDLSHLVRQKVVTNIILTLTIKFLVIGLSIFGYASMWHAVVADVGVTILAIANAASIFREYNS